MTQWLQRHTLGDTLAADPAAQRGDGATLLIPVPLARCLFLTPAKDTSAALNETHDMNSTFTRDDGDEENGSPLPQGQDGAPNVPVTPAAKTPAAKTPRAKTTAKTPKATAKTPKAKTPARTPARLLQQQQAVESPKTPSLDDVGLSAAALSILQQTNGKHAGRRRGVGAGRGASAREGSAAHSARKAERHGTETRKGAAQVASLPPSGHSLRTAATAADADSHNSSLDMSTFQMSSVPLKTPDASRSRLNMSVVATTTPAPLSAASEAKSMATTPAAMMVSSGWGAKREGPWSVCQRRLHVVAPLLATAATSPPLLPPPSLFPTSRAPFPPTWPCPRLQTAWPRPPLKSPSLVRFCVERPRLLPA